MPFRAAPERSAKVRGFATWLPTASALRGCSCVKWAAPPRRELAPSKEAPELRSPAFDPVAGADRQEECLQRCLGNLSAYCGARFGMRSLRRLTQTS
jgi:hypothetical protein